MSDAGEVIITVTRRQKFCYTNRDVLNAQLQKMGLPALDWNPEEAGMKHFGTLQKGDKMELFPDVQYCAEVSLFNAGAGRVDNYVLTSEQGDLRVMSIGCVEVYCSLGRIVFLGDVFYHYGENVGPSGVYTITIEHGYPYLPGDFVFVEKTEEDQGE